MTSVSIRPAEASILSERPEVQAVVFVDDFIGTGDTAVTGLEDFFAGFHQHADATVGLYFIAIAGLSRGKSQLQAALAEQSMSVEAHVATETVGGCFRAGSTVFGSDRDREFAEQVAKRYGRKLVKNAPLGYQNCQALTVFESSIPNDCPAVLWHGSGDWTPLFKRQ